MPAPPIFIAATSMTDNVVHVEWRVGLIKPKALLKVSLPAEVSGKNAYAVAELTAIRYLVENRKAGTSIRQNPVTVSQRAVKDLLNQKAEESSLIPYGRHLYLYVSAENLSVATAKWAADIEFDPEREGSVTAVEGAWPKVPCSILQADAAVTRHAVDRYIERRGVKADHWHAYQKILKALASKSVREVPEEEIARTNPGMRRGKNTKVLHHQDSDTAFIMVKDAGEWVLATVHHYHQEFVPTFVRGRVEYRRNPD